ncbi:MAG: peptidylprolyl isomerase [Verrucomicrobiae bacterium]|nr:peptidylprolyl isomerase [Verrucomicrobiae bacterium]
MTHRLRHYCLFALAGILTAGAANVAISQDAPVAQPVATPTSPVTAKPASDEVLGKIGEFEVKISDVRKSLETLTAAEREAMRSQPSALNQYVRALLVQKIVLREATAKGWDESEEVKERMSLLRDGVVATTFLESVSQPPAGFPSDEEVRAAYNANREALRVPKSWRLSQIFVADPAEDIEAPPSAEANAKMTKLADLLVAEGADFGAIAREHSEEEMSAERNGEIGWLAEPQIQPAVRDILPGLKLGEISAPVRMLDGWHFIKVLDIREPFVPTLEQIREQLVARLKQERSRAETQAFLGQLLRDNPIAVNEMVLSKLIPAESN